jgi:hypothetical protein
MLQPAEVRIWRFQIKRFSPQHLFLSAKAAMLPIPIPRGRSHRIPFLMSSVLVLAKPCRRSTLMSLLLEQGTIQPLAMMARYKGQ